MILCNGKELRVLLTIMIIVFGLERESYSQSNYQREAQLFNNGWKFSLGHAHDVHKDFNFTTSHFSYLAKAGYGDGAAAFDFDDRAWRDVQIPHDWCVALPFDEKGSNSHGSKAIGKYFPENSVGWYRNRFFIPESDTANLIYIEFEGVYRNAKVFVNGFYLGTEESGYSGFRYAITEYVNFGGENVIAVRVDATEEEGWFYEGAGIYRNVWLVKTHKVHFYEQMPIYVKTHSVETTKKGTQATVVADWTVINESDKKVDAIVTCTIVNAQNQIVDTQSKTFTTTPHQHTYSASSKFYIKNPQLWSVQNPALYTIIVCIEIDGKIVETQNIPFGIRTIKMTANNGLFINNESVKIKGVCVHQDHAGVGVAIPYDLQKWRIQQLQAIGVNAIRTSHNPPSPDLLAICDELGMLVMNEVRLMGVNEYHKKYVRELILRDRNHPSVFIWSLGNEEWAIEGNKTGARIVQTMEKYARSFDSLRPFTVACSGGWDTGIGTKVQVMGYNYINHGDVDGHHTKFPWQPSIGTEESNTVRTRGVYTTNDEKCWLAPTNLYDDGMEGGWKFYAERDYLAGLFYWTGFDYRGEPTPYTWPGVVSQFGILDLCGFPKDNAFYLKSWWWNQEPLVHVEHNWIAEEGDSVNLVIYSNCREVELLVNATSLGKKQVPYNGHITWPVKYSSGTLLAKGYGHYGTVDSTSFRCSAVCKTPKKPASVHLTAHTNELRANGSDVAIISLLVYDEDSVYVGNAQNSIQFEIEGPGKIIGLGNGNPSSHEKEQFLETIVVKDITDLKEKIVPNLTKRPETKKGFKYDSWNDAFSSEPVEKWNEYKDSLLVIRGTFTIDSLSKDAIVTLFAKQILAEQTIYINGVAVSTAAADNSQTSYVLPANILTEGRNEYCVTGKRIPRPDQWSFANQDPGLVQIIYPIQTITRSAFQGAAQVLVQTTTHAGTIIVKATSEEIQSNELIITTK